MTAEAAADRFQTSLGLSPVFARLLAARGWRETAELTAFLFPRLEHTHAPWLMRGMLPAVERIQRAIAAGEAIRILGDYDADGTLATVILRQALSSLGARVSYHLPERLSEGYGLHIAAIEAAAADGVTLAITVDTGIRELTPIARARELGLDIIVTDHHLPGPELPPAFAILNPHQPECGYPDKGLCGSAVAFKLAQALLERGGKLNGEAWPPGLKSYLKLVALGTVADAVPLLGESRILTRFGLQGLADPVNPGLRALLSLALPPGRTTVSARDVAFGIAPRLNAAGRLGRSDRIVALFGAPAAQAAALAAELDGMNIERQRLCAAILAEIESRAGGWDAPVLVLAGEGWHRGVLGIVASRVLERSGKPTLIVGIENGTAHGSGRAPVGTHLLQLLETCADLFDRYGGHAQAVGFALPGARIEELRARLSAAVAEAPAWTPASAAPGFEVRLKELTLGFARELARLEPYGEANPEPIFRTRGVTLAAPPTQLKDRHLKLQVEQDGQTHTALFWNLWRDGVYQAPPGRAKWEALQPGVRLDLEFRLEANSHPQYGERLQLILREFSVTSALAGESHRAAARSSALE